MELLETQDPEKRKLIETSDRHRRELEKEVNEITAKTERLVTNALIIGGSLAVTYFVISRLTKSKSKIKKINRSKPKAVAEDVAEDEEEDEAKAPSTSIASVGPSLISQIGMKVISQASLVLLGIAREKLNEYLYTRKNKDENS